MNTSDDMIRDGYGGKPDCQDMRCRRAPQPDGTTICAGWHCGACGQPTGQYGHSRGDGTFSCQEGSPIEQH